MDRIEMELALLRSRFRNVAHVPQGNWVRIKDYSLPEGWNRSSCDVAFMIVAAPAAPYGIYVPAGLQFRGQRPNNYTEPANTPFEGVWGMFSWMPADGEWCPATEVAQGSNYLHWALGIARRFSEGI